EIIARSIFDQEPILGFEVVLGCYGVYTRGVFLSWLDQEPKVRTLVREFGRLVGRGKRHRFLTIGLVLLCTLVVVVRQATKKDLFTASVTFRLVDERTSLYSSPLPPNRLREYFYNGFFTKPRSLELIKKHKVFQSQYAVDQNWAIEEFRDAIDIKVFRNYFLLDEEEESRTRTARIMIRFTYPDESLAWAIVRELGDIIRENEASRRRALTEQAAELSAAAVEKLQEELLRLKSRLSARHVELLQASGAKKAQMQFEMYGIQQSIERQRLLLEELERESAERQLSVDQELRQMGLHFDQVDWGRPRPPSEFSRAIYLLILGLVVFVVFLPVVAILVGAMDTKVYHLEDIRRLGLAPLGRVPIFTGYGIGAFLNRRDRSRDQLSSVKET
ncbi:MAG: hypothetical protein V1754_13710, partial [Pseudomonadota bacterium]